MSFNAYGVICLEYIGIPKLFLDHKTQKTLNLKAKINAAETKATEMKTFGIRYETMTTFMFYEKARNGCLS